jgi:capsular polysaccharide biosynthesis protein
MTSTYTATAGVLFTPVSTSDSGQDLAFAAQYTQSRMVVYQGLVDSPQVLGVVVSTLDLSVTPTKLADDVSARFDPSSTLLTVEVENESANQAAKIAAAVAQSLINTVGQFETQADPSAKADEPQTVERVSGKLVSDPAVPASPSSPDLKLNVAAGVLLGLLLGFAQAGSRFARARFAPPEPPADLQSAEDPADPPSPMNPLNPLNPPKLTQAPPRTAKPKSQKRPGRRTRRS